MKTKATNETRQHDLDHLPWGIYKRVSSVDQAEKYSPQSQDRNCRSWLEAKGKRVSEQHVFEDHETGTNTDRRDFQRMIESVKRREVAGYIVYTVDRLSRSVEDALITNKVFVRYGVELAFCNYKFENSSVGDFMFTVMASVAKLEHSMIMERCANGRRDKMLAKLMTNGSAPVGYRYVKGAPAGQQLEVVEHEAELVRRIYAMYRGGKSLYDIVRVLRSEGVRTKRDKPYSRPTLRRILCNVIYTGQLVIDQKSDNPIVIDAPAIISRELFRAVGSMLIENRKARSGQPSKQHLLTGYVVCKLCKKRRWRVVRTTGSNSSRNGKRYFSYACASAQDRYAAEPKEGCGCCSVSATKLETTVWSKIATALKSPGMMYRLAKEYFDKSAKPTAGDATQKRMRYLEGRIERNRKARREPDEDWDTLTAEIREMSDELRGLQAKIDSENAPVPLPPQKVFEACCAEWSDGFDEATEDFEVKRGVLQRFVETITTDGKYVEIKAKLAIPAAKYCNVSFKRSNNTFIYVPIVLRERIAA